MVYAKCMLATVARMATVQIRNMSGAVHRELKAEAR